jgi:Papain-like cysteine protease AvrRpt2
MPTLAFALEQQEQDFWCWAAVGVSVNTFYHGAARSQCELANLILGPHQCCTHGDSPQCDQAAKLSEVLTALGHLAAPVVHEPVAAQALIDQIDATRVLCARVARAGDNVGHFIAIVGYDAVSPNPMLVIQDPDRDIVHISYATLKTDYFGAYAWTHTYLTI